MRPDSMCVRELDEIAENCNVIKKRIPHGFSFPLHWHNYYECEILLSGRGEHLCNGVRYSAQAGDCWLMSFYDFHAYRAETEQEMIHIIFERGYLSKEMELLIAAGGFCCRLEGDPLREVIDLCDRILGEGEQDALYLSLSRRALIERLLILLLRASVRAPAQTSSQIAELLSYMHAHFREDLTVESVAATQGLSPNYFGNRFKAAMGISFRDYLNKIRLKFACQLLSASNLSVREIALASGYSSVEYFFYVFKKHLSTTPAEYRRSRNANDDGHS